MFLFEKDALAAAVFFKFQNTYKCRGRAPNAKCKLLHPPPPSDEKLFYVYVVYTSTLYTVYARTLLSIKVISQYASTLKFKFSKLLAKGNLWYSTP